MNTTDLYSRKFILTVLCALLVSAAFFIGKLTSLEWLAFLSVNILGYGVLNLIDNKDKQPGITVLHPVGFNPTPEDLIAAKNFTTTIGGSGGE